MRPQDVAPVMATQEEHDWLVQGHGHSEAESKDAATRGHSQVQQEVASTGCRERRRKRRYAALSMKDGWLGMVIEMLWEERRIGEETKELGFRNGAVAGR